MDLLNPYYLQIVMFFIINAIMGSSIYFTLASGQLSLGAAGFMSVGAYVGAILSLKADLPIVLGIIIGGLVASLVAVIIGLPTTRLRGLYLAIATLGFGEVVRVIFLNLDITNGALGLSGIPSIPQTKRERVAALPSTVSTTILTSSGTSRRRDRPRSSRRWRWSSPSSCLADP